MYKDTLQDARMRELQDGDLWYFYSAAEHIFTKQLLHYGLFQTNTSCPAVSYLDRVQVGAHDDLVEGSGQFGRQLGFLLQTLGLGVVIQSGTGEEVVDHSDTVMLPWGGERGAMNAMVVTCSCFVREQVTGYLSETLDK